WIENEDHAWPSNIGSYNGKGTGESAGALRIKFIGVGPNDEGMMDVGHALVEALKNEKIDSYLSVGATSNVGTVVVGPSTRLYEFTAEERVELVESTTRHHLAELKRKLHSEEVDAQWAWERAERERNTAYEVGSTEVYMEHSTGGLFTRMEILEVVDGDPEMGPDRRYIVRPLDGFGVSEVSRRSLRTKSESEAREKLEHRSLPENRRERLAVYR
ncbi:hypothetical protein CMI37_29370, partial [Candidatus Pacearchaeota archaeon]|nr:hypothetical protein [Candidatus Pacearchaeota archaeon]